MYKQKRNKNINFEISKKMMAIFVMALMIVSGLSIIGVIKESNLALGSSAKSGPIVAWGTNYMGECNVPSPNSDFTAVSVGYYYSLGLKVDGSIAAWGDNNYGQCNVPSPNSDFTAIDAGVSHSLGLKADGSIAVWGDNSDGQCNVPSPNSDFTAVAAGEFVSLGLKTNGSVICWGDTPHNFLSDVPYQTNVWYAPEPNSGFIAIGADSDDCYGLKTNGSVLYWGYNTQYHSINYYWFTTEGGYTAIAVGYNTCVGLKANGSINVIGGAKKPVPSPNSGFTAIAVGKNFCLGLRADGSIAAWGQNDYGQCNVPSPNSGFTAIAAGAYNCLGLKAVASQNTQPTAGFSYNPLNPTTEDTIQFTDISTDTDGTITSWLWNFGDGNTTTQMNPTYKFNEARTYSVSLQVTDNNGGSNTKTASIIVTVSDNSNGKKNTSGTSDDSSNKKNTPGFELIIAVYAIAFILFWRRRRVANH